MNEFKCTRQASQRCSSRRPRYGGGVNACSVADYESGESAGIVSPQVATASYRPDQVGQIMRNKDWDYSVVPPHSLEYRLGRANITWNINSLLPSN